MGIEMARELNNRRMVKYAIVAFLKTDVRLQILLGKVIHRMCGKKEMNPIS